MGYVCALKNAFPFMSLGEMGVVACMAAKAVGVSQVQVGGIVPSWLNADVLRQSASGSLRSRCKCAAWYEVGSIEGSFPCARAPFPPSIPSVDRSPFWRAHKLRRSVVLLQERMHDNDATGANCDLLPDHHAPSRGSSPSRPRPMPGAGSCAVPGLAHLLIALSQRPWSRISYLTTCHSRHSPAATDNWTLGGTLRRTTGQLPAILGGLVARQVICFRRGQAYISG